MPHMSSSFPRRRVIVRALATACATVMIAAPTVMADDDTDAQAEADYVRGRLEAMTLEEKVGQLFVTHVYGSSATEVTPGQAASNQAAYGVDTPAEVVQKYHLGGVIYFSWSGNVDTPTQVAQLSNGLQQAAAEDGTPPLTIAADQETGLVARMPAPATEFPGAQALAAGGRTRDARNAARITASELRAVGITQNFAPVADVNVNPENPVIGVRSFSSDPAIAADFVGAQVGSYQRHGVAAAAKHFPGHGDTTEDSHFDLPEIDHTRAEWEAIDRPPFQTAIDEGVDVIMTAHIVVDSLDPSGNPATLSRPIVTGLLRDEMGYDGVIITDAMNMDAIVENWGSDRAGVLALQAGVDQLLVPEDGHMDVMYQSILDAVRGGEIAEERIDASVARVLGLKWRRGVVDDPYVDVSAVDRRVGNRAHLAAAQRITDPTVTALRNPGMGDDAGDALLPVDADGSSVLVASASGSAGDALSAALARRGAEVDTMITGSSPTGDEIAAAVDAAGEHDLTLVVTSRAWVNAPGTGQRALVGDIAAAGHDVVAVASRDAYDVAYLPPESGFLAAYSTTAVSMRSVAKVVTGEIAPMGHLPVDVPAADGSAILFPIGSGLTWPVSDRP